MTLAPTVDAVEFPAEALYLDGQWQTPAEAGRFEVINPATEEVVGVVPVASADLAREAIAAAARGFETWSRTDVETRAATLEALADAMERHRLQLGALASAEIGTPIRDALAGQVDLPVRVLRSYAQLAREYPWDVRDAAGSSIVREGAGVVLAITPWNFPVHQIVSKLAPALAAGCSVVLKPAELTPLNALFLAALTEQIGLPPGVFNVVTGKGSVVGEALLQSRGYEVVSFTGSLGVGRHVGAVAGDAIVRATLELGGKSPAVVLEDADLETAVRTTVRNCFVNAGQKCNAPTRLIVPRDRVGEAVELATEVAESYVIGDPSDERTTMGPLVSAEQRDIVTGFIAGARAEGATIATGGDRSRWDRGFFLTPAIVTDVARGSVLAREEVFGPVLAVLGHEGEEDAVALANDTEYGLSSEVWSADPARVAALARRIRAGQVRVNGVRTPALPVSPFGGYKRSGLGRELGELGLDEFVEVKAILGDPVVE
ncbi:aldehyde dehydrogenase family protein [Microbacterium aurum]